MSKDPFKASIQCLMIITLAISMIVYFTDFAGLHSGSSSGEMAVGAALFAGVYITGHLAVLAAALWVLSHFFK